MHLDSEVTHSCIRAWSDRPRLPKLHLAHTKSRKLPDSLQLTQATLDSLHGLCSYLKRSDYPNAVAFYTNMVSGPGFAEIAAFMPALKVLITLANQQGVQF